MRIVQKLIPVSNKFTRPGKKRIPRTITIHETGNTKPGANALSHATLQFNGNSRQASWHYQVDDKDIIYQSIPDDENAWAGGDGKDGIGNTYSIHIEICVNSDGNFWTALHNAAWLVARLLDKHNLQLKDVVQHNKWSGKNCPERLRSGKGGHNWNDFISLVNDYGKQANSVKQPKEKVEENSHATAWEWGTELGLVNGTKPTDPVTRQQLITILHRIFVEKKIKI